MAERKKLGRGLSALLGEDDTQNRSPAAAGAGPGGREVPIEALHPGPYQPRHRVDQEAIEELAASIKDKGVLQPILVRRGPAGHDDYEIIAGERRWRAAQLAGLHEVPIVVKQLSDQETLEVALIENLQREDLSPLEEAQAYQRLMSEFDHTQEALAQSLGKSRSHVANTVRLLGLPEAVKAYLDDGRLTAGHARALLGQDNAADLARQVVAKGLNVRQTEALASRKPAPGKPAGRAAAKAGAKKDADTLALEQELGDTLGIRVEIDDRGGAGVLALHYGSLDELDALLGMLSRSATGRAPAPASDPDPDPESGAGPAAARSAGANAGGGGGDSAGPPADKPKLSVSLKPKVARTG